MAAVGSAASTTSSFTVARWSVIQGVPMTTALFALVVLLELAGALNRPQANRP